MMKIKTRVFPVALTVVILALQTACASGREAGQLADMAGAWRLDFDRVDPSLFGTGIQYGNDMQITEDGEFSYYIGIGIGGTGECVEEDGAVTVEIEPYENLSPEKEILSLTYHDENSAEYIEMLRYDETLYWLRDRGGAVETE
ncbi:MAG: hypothetical protein NC180_00600 [Muribaculaceae bacterium]|nr:hypothetical protein [Roseburia sp.]MCM1430927.1 hypothetical protein [Muribaculaceae bacterium]MCM1491712.1 hypothetical protein [Muribaculaceae bacterium]